MLLPPDMSWPTWQWWSHLSSIEQGTWLSGIGTLIAASAALLISTLSYVTRNRERKRVSLAGDYKASLLLYPIFATLAATAEAAAMNVERMEDGASGSEQDVRDEFRLATFEAAERLIPTASTVSPKLAVNVLSTLSWCRQYVEAISMCFQRQTVSPSAVMQYATPSVGLTQEVICLVQGENSKKHLLLTLAVVTHFAMLAATEMEAIVNRAATVPDDLLDAQRARIERKKAANSKSDAPQV
jgi:hypothetical protein